MSSQLTEEQMRRALFGPSEPNDPPAVVDTSELQFVPSKRATVIPAAPKKTSSSLFPKVRVTMRVTKTFEGVQEVLVHEARTLSTLVAEQEARSLAKRKKFKYVEIVSIVQV